MANWKVAICIIGGLALAGIVAAVLLRSRIPPTQRSFGTLGQRLLAHSRDRDDYRLLVGVPPANPTAWAEVARIDDSSVTLRDSQVIDLSAVTAYLVAYPSGVPVDVRRNKLPPPAWVKFPNRSGPRDQDRLSASDLKEGWSLVRVDFGRSTSKPTSPNHYSTTLTNISGRRVRVVKFGGYPKTQDGFLLNTITSRFFTADDFKEWYGQKGDWIEQGQSVTDPNNYGSPPVMWAYYCEAEGGKEFLTGGIIE